MDNGNTQNTGENQISINPDILSAPKTPSVEHDQRALGNIAITTPETTPETTHDIAPQPEQAPEPASAPELGQITPSMPPGYKTSNPASPPTPQSEAQTFSFSPSHSMAGDHLSPQAVSALQDRERELSANGDIASFVDFIDTARDEFQGKEAT